MELLPYGVLLGNSTPPRRAKLLPSAKLILELAKGFEPLTL
jgi:hypothetical protein